MSPRKTRLLFAMTLTPSAVELGDVSHPRAGAGDAGFGILPLPALPMLCRSDSAWVLGKALQPPVPAAAPLSIAATVNLSRLVSAVSTTPQRGSPPAKRQP